MYRTRRVLAAFISFLLLALPWLAPSVQAAPSPATLAVYALGGTNASGALDTVEAYNSVSHCWSSQQCPPLAAMPTARTGLAAVDDAQSGLIYAIGGSSGSGSVVNTVEAYDPATGAWSQVTPMPTARSGLAAVYDPQSGLIYAIGGSSGSGSVVNTVETYNPSNGAWSEVAPMPTARSGLAAVFDAQNGLIYAIGGSDGSGSVVNTVETYNPSNGAWSQVVPMGTARSGLAAAYDAQNGLIYAIGGSDGSGSVVNTVETYNPSNGAWSQVVPMGTARSGLAAAYDAQSGLIYAIGGSDGSGPLSSVEAYDPNTKLWSSVAAMPTARSGLAATVAPILTAVAGVNVTPTPDTAGATAQYAISFTTSASGALPGGTGTIDIGLTDSQSFPTSPSDWQVNGQQPASVAQVGGSGAPPDLVLTLAASQSIAASTPVTIAVSNVTNPAAGPYSLSVSTSADTQAVSAAYAIGSAQNSVSGVSVTPLPATAGANADYLITFATSASGALAGGTGTINIGLTDSQSFPTSPSDWQVNGQQPASVAQVGGSGAPPGLVLTLAASQNIAASTPVTVAVSNVTNPAAGSYSLSVSTSADTQAVSAAYAIGSAQNSVSGVSVTPIPATAGANADYLITFATSASGALPGGTGTISIGLTDSQSFPTSPSDWQVNGQQPASVAQVGGSGAPPGLVLTLAASQSIAASTPVTVAVSNVTNPAAGPYSLSVSTSADTQAVSAAYAIGSAQNSVSGVSVTPLPATAGANADYLITFATSASGALPGGTGTINIGLTDGQSFPTSPSNWQVNGQQPASVAQVGGSGAPPGLVLTLAASQSIAASTPVTVAVSNVTNPAAGSYSLSVSTSADIQAVSAAYAIGSAQNSVSGVSVTPTPDTAGATAQYTISFATSPSGALAGGTGTISIGLTDSQSFPTSPSDWQVNGQQPASVAQVGGSGAPPGLVLTLAASQSIAASTPVTVAVSNVTNPAAGPYSLSVSTSADTQAVSAAYAIGSAQNSVSAVSVTPTPATAGTTAQYTISFTTSPSGALTGGTGTISIGLTDGQSFPTSPSNWQVNGQQPASVAQVGGSGAPPGLVLTLAASQSIAASTPVTVAVSNVTNPVAGPYSLSVSTSADTQAVSAAYQIASAASLPDLAVTAGSGPATAVPGQSITVSWTVENVGSGTANGTFDDAVYLSGTSSLGSGATLLGSFGGESPLAAQASYTASQTLTIPLATTPGAYYLVFETNSTGALVESDASSDANNTFSVPITVVSPVLAITTASNLPTATTNTPYSLQLQASGGSGSYTWSIISYAQLPDGLSLSPSGLISGTPPVGDAGGINDVTIQVADTSTPQETATLQAQIKVVGSTVQNPSVQLSSLAQGAVGVTYTVTFTTSSVGAITSANPLGVDIMLQAPLGTVFPSQASAYGVRAGAADVAVQSVTVTQGDSATITLGGSGTIVPAGTVVTVTVTGVSNPPVTSSADEIQVSTAGDPGVAVTGDYAIRAVSLPNALADSSLTVSANPILVDTSGGGSTPSETVVVELLDSSGNPVSGKTVDLSVVSPAGSPSPWTASPSTATTGQDGKASFTVSLPGGYGMAGTLLIGATDETDGQFIAGASVGIYFYQFSFAGGEYVGVTEAITGSGLPPNAAVTAATFGGVPLTLSTCATDAYGDLSQCYFVVPTATTGQSYPIVLTIGGLEFSQNFTVAQNPAGIPASIAITSGDNQSTPVGTQFASPLSVTVDDGLFQPVKGVTVTFKILPSGQGAGATFAGGGTTATAQTNSQGIAISPYLTANATVGSYQVVAYAAGTNSVDFTFNNTPGSPASIRATQGGTQDAVAGQAYAEVLAASVKDQNGNPVPNVEVTFTAPASGPTGTFPNGQESYTAMTDGNGTAWAPTFTAGQTTGSFTVTATVSGVSAAADFTLIAANAVLASCDGASLGAAFAAGGYVALDCDGTIQLPQTLSVPGSLEVTLDATGHSVTLQAPQRPAGATVESGYTDRVFDVEGGSLTLIGLTITGGGVQGAQGAGGAAGAPGQNGQNGQGTPGTQGAAGQDGAAGAPAQGGAIYISAGSHVTVERSVFTENFAQGGLGGDGGAGGSGGAGGGGGMLAGAAHTTIPAGAGGPGGQGGNGGPGGDGQGGAIYNLGSLSLVDTSFFDNIAQGGIGGSGSVGGAGGQGGLGVPGQKGASGADGTCANGGTGAEGYPGGNGAPGGAGGSSGGGGAGGDAMGGAVYNLGSLDINGGTFAGNQARAAAGGGQLPQVSADSAAANSGGIGGVGGQGGQGGSGGNSVEPQTGCASNWDPAKDGVGGSGGQGGTAGQSGDSAGGGFGGAGGPGGDAQGGAVWDGGVLSVDGATFGNIAGGGNFALGGAGGPGGTGGSAADGVQAMGGPGGSPGVGCENTTQGAQCGFFAGKAGKAGVKGLKSAGAYGGWGGDGGDGGGAQGGALYVLIGSEATISPGLVFSTDADANGAQGGVAGGAGQGGFDKCSPTLPSGQEGLYCDGAKRAQSGIAAENGSASGNDTFLGGVQNQQLVVTTTSLPGGAAGGWYQALLQATDGTAPYAWSLAAGSSLPPGLALDSATGVISGSVTASSGMYFFTVQAEDSSTAQQTATETLSIDIVPAAAEGLAGGPVVTGSSDATSDTANGSASAGGSGTGTPDTSATASGGEGTVAVADYSVDPIGAPTFQSAGQYFDIAVSTPSQGGFQSVTATECGVVSGDTVYWSPDGTTWEAASPQSYDAQTGCITLGPFNAGSTPTLAELTGTVFAVAAPTIALSAGDALSFAPSTLAPQGSLNPGDTETTEVTATNAQGVAIPGATIYLFVASGTLGSASAEGVALTGSPQAFTADGKGQIAVTYTAPASPPASGVDQIIAQSDRSAGPAVRASASYNFAAPVPLPTSVTLTASPVQVQANGTATISGRVYDAGGNPVPNAYVDLSVSAGLLSAATVTTAADGSYSAIWTSPPGGGAAVISASVEGVPSPLTAQALITPPGVSATTLSAEAVAGSATLGGSGALPDTMGTASGGSGTLTLAAYSADPEGPLSFLSGGTYFDAYLSPGSTFTQLRLVQCGAVGANAVYWWTSTAGTGSGAWMAVPVSQLQFGAPGRGCVTITLTGATSPSLADLTGTPFAVGTVSASTGGTGGGQPGSSGGSGTTSPTGVGSAGGVLQTADGDFTMAVGPGTIATGEELSLAESPGPSSGLPPGMIAASETFTLSGAELSSPVAATIRYSPSALRGLSPELLAVYAARPGGGWTFLPTGVGRGSVSVYVSGPETLVVLLATSRPTDVPSGYWAAKPIERLLAYGVAQGLVGGRFDPGARLTRAQFVKMLVLALGLAPATSGTTPFKDVPVESWYAPYVAAALQAGITDGVTARAFRPEAPIPREQMAVLLARAFALKSSGALTFTDAAEIGSFARAGVEAVVTAGLMEGLPGNSFAPLADTTRAQAAAAMALAIDRLAP